MMDKMKKNNKQMPRLEVLWRPSLLSEGLTMPKKFSQLEKNVAMLASVSFFHPCLKFSTGEVLAIM